jgi:general secretion pathway protein D
MEGVTLQEALNQILSANNLFYKVVNQRTILVSPDNAQKRAQYEELVIKTYYISNADPTDVQTVINQVGRVGGGQLLPVMAVNKANNTLTVRATEAMMAVIDRMIAAADKPRAEIVIDVQIMEVNRSRAKPSSSASTSGSTRSTASSRRRRAQWAMAARCRAAGSTPTASRAASIPPTSTWRSRPRSCVSLKPIPRPSSSPSRSCEDRKAGC